MFNIKEQDKFKIFHMSPALMHGAYRYSKVPKTVLVHCTYVSFGTGTYLPDGRTPKLVDFIHNAFASKLSTVRKCTNEVCKIVQKIYNLFLQRDSRNTYVPYCGTHSTWNWPAWRQTGAGRREASCSARPRCCRASAPARSAACPPPPPGTAPFSTDKKAL
jgi:hypothetical protein